MEHKTREWFTYKGKAIFGPHFNVNSLWEICSHIDIRESINA